MHGIDDLHVVVIGDEPLERRADPRERRAQVLATVRGHEDQSSHRRGRNPCNPTTRPDPVDGVNDRIPREVHAVGGDTLVE